MAKPLHNKLALRIRHAKFAELSYCVGPSVGFLKSDVSVRCLRAAGANTLLLATVGQTIDYNLVSNQISPNILPGPICLLLRAAPPPGVTAAAYFFLPTQIPSLMAKWRTEPSDSGWD